MFGSYLVISYDPSARYRGRSKPPTIDPLELDGARAYATINMGNARSLVLPSSSSSSLLELPSVPEPEPRLFLHSHFFRSFFLSQDFFYFYFFNFYSGILLLLSILRADAGRSRGSSRCTMQCFSSEQTRRTEMKIHAAARFLRSAAMV